MAVEADANPDIQLAALKADTRKAHKRIKVMTKDWRYQTAQGSGRFFVHIVGMYGLAPVVGRQVDRFGANRAIRIGAVVLGAGTVSTVIAGYVPAMMFVGLFFLGLGWNVGLIGGSTLLTKSVPADARVEVQGTSDLTMSLAGAAAAFGSGFVKESFGFHEYVDLNTGVLLSSTLFTKVVDPANCHDQKTAGGTFDMFDAKLVSRTLTLALALTRARTPTLARTPTATATPTLTLTPTLALTLTPTFTPTLTRATASSTWARSPSGSTASRTRPRQRASRRAGWWPLTLNLTPRSLTLALTLSLALTLTLNLIRAAR